MAQIRITSIPTGEAPEWVRKEWVGLVLPTTINWEGTRDTFTEEVLEGKYRGSLGGPPDPDNMGGFHVQTRKAIEALFAKSPEAANWWKKNVNLGGIEHLVFGKKFCEVVT
ncbi:MAG: hypothetical protein Q8Q95_04480 [bacterium]|nr:hypothetical protein [bacterium]